MNYFTKRDFPLFSQPVNYDTVGVAISASVLDYYPKGGGFLE